MELPVYKLNTREKKYFHYIRHRNYNYFSDCLKKWIEVNY